MQAEYCLNLHEKYAPNWGIWEVVRELYANAKDAAPDTMRINTSQPDILTIDTPTVPDLAELLIIGHGSKAPGGQSIGQFGEGFKLAALAATRSGGRLAARVPGKQIGFTLRDHLGESVLYAIVSDVEDDEFMGFRVQLEMEGADTALTGRILKDGSQSHIIEKEAFDPTQIYCKGIWITDLDEENTLFSYNLNDVELNRDRSHADPWSVRHGIGHLLSRSLTPELAQTLVRFGTSWEAGRCLEAAEYSFNTEVRAMLGEAFRAVHGSQALLRTDARASAMASEFGYQTIMVGDGLRNLLAEVVATDTKVMAGKYEFDALPHDPVWDADLQELRILSDLCGIRDFEVKVFADTVGSLVGKAEFESQVMWLNERLFGADNRLERVRTFLHELGHLQSAGASDGSRRFEDSLDLLLGKLGLAILNGRGLDIQHVDGVA